MKIKLWFLLSAILYLFGKGQSLRITGTSFEEHDNLYLALYKRKRKVTLYES